MTNSRYCPVHNPFGTFKDINGKNWYESSYPINSVFDAHQNVGTALARPDSKNKGIVYKNDFIELHTTIKEDTLFEAEKRRSAYYGGFGGVSGLVSTVAVQMNPSDAKSMTPYEVKDLYPEGLTYPDGTKMNVVDKAFYAINITRGIDLTSVAWKYRNSMYFDSDGGYKGDTIILNRSKRLPVLSNKNSLVTDIIGDPSQYVSTDSTYIANDGNTDTDVTDMPINTLVWDTETNRMFKAKVDAELDLTDSTPSVAFTDDAKWTPVQKGYTQSWLDRLSSGKPLIGMFSNLVNKNTGGSQIFVDNNTAISGFNILCSEKGIEIYNIIRNDGGDTDWNPAPNQRINTDNELISRGWLQNLMLTTYTKANQPMQVSTPKQITYVSNKVVNSNSHSIYQAGLITNSITDGISTSDELVKLESKVLENAILDNVGLIVTEPSQVSPTLSGSTSKASKSIFGVAVDGSKHYDMVFGEEVRTNWDGSSEITTSTDDTVTDGKVYHYTPTDKLLLTIGTSFDISDGATYSEVTEYNSSTKFKNLTNGTSTDDTLATVNTKVLARQSQYRR